MRGDMEPDPAQAVCAAPEWLGIPALDRSADRVKLELETSHWWYQGRRRIVLDFVRRLNLPEDAAILDAGCGNGSILDGLRRHGRVTAVDVNPEAVAQARRREAEVLLSPLVPLPLEGQRFALVTCLDVLEHVPDDRAALSELLRVTQPGGLLLLTVPAYPGLWSAHDVAAGHRRRYGRAQLISLARESGWEPRLDTHFNTLLLPVAALRRGLTRHGAQPRSDLLATSPRLNPLLEMPLRAEARWLAGGRRPPNGDRLLGGRRLPWGLSILAVFVRPGAAP